MGSPSCASQSTSRLEVDGLSEQGGWLTRRTRIVKGQLVGDTPSRPSAEPTYLEILEENKSLHRKIAAQQQVLDELRPGVGAVPGGHARGRERNAMVGQSPSVLPLLSTTPGPSKRQRQHLSCEQVDPHYGQTNGHVSEQTYYGRGSGRGEQDKEPYAGEEKLEILSSIAQLRGITDWHPSAQAVVRPAFPLHINNRDEGLTSDTQRRPSAAPDDFADRPSRQLSPRSIPHLFLAMASLCLSRPDLLGRARGVDDGAARGEGREVREELRVSGGV